MSKILVLPGTIWQLPLMEKIKELGHELFIVNPIRVSGVTEITNHFLEADIFAYNKIIKYCKDNCIDVVMSDECDIATEIVAKYNEVLGANHLDIEMAQLFTNKFLMREFCEKENIAPIPHKICQKVEDAIGFFEEMGEKSIMKPINSNASHGVFTINNVSDILLHFDDTIKFSRDLEAVLIEKYIDGVEFTVDGIMTDKGHKTLAISEKKHYNHNENIANSLLFTQKSEQFDYKLLRETNDTLLDTTGLPFGLTHVEYKFYEGKFYLIEMAARGGGNLISSIIVPFMSDVDSYDYLIKKTLNKNYDIDIFPSIDNERVALLKFLDLPCNEGVVLDIIGEEYFEEEPCIKSYMLNFRKGDFVKQPENDSVRAGYYIICAETREQLEKVVKNIDNKFKLIIT